MGERLVTTLDMICGTQRMHTNTSRNISELTIQTTMKRIHNVDSVTTSCRNDMYR